MSALIECLLPATLSALSGQGPALHQHMLTPPPNLLEEVSSPPNSQKLLRGNVFADDTNIYRYTKHAKVRPRKTKLREKS